MDCSIFHPILHASWRSLHQGATRFVQQAPPATCEWPSSLHHASARQSSMRQLSFHAPIGVDGVDMRLYETSKFTRQARLAA